MPFEEYAPLKSLPVRALEIIFRASGRTWALSFVLLICIALLVLAGAAIWSPSCDPVQHVEQYDQYGQEDKIYCSEAQNAKNSASGNNANSRDGRGDEAHEKDTELRTALLNLCVSRFSARQSFVANKIATEYNRISFDAASWARIGGIIVTILGVASVIGIIVAVFAASDARRAIDVGLLSVETQRRASRAFVRLVDDPQGLLPPRVRNAGSTPAILYAIRLVDLEQDMHGCDPSVLTWHDHAMNSDLLGPSEERLVLLPFVAPNRPFGILVGMAFEDVHGDGWCSWRHCRLDLETGLVRFGRSGEFPLG